MLFGEKEITLKDGRKAVLKNPCIEDAAQFLDFITTASGQTEFLMRYPEEWAGTTIEQEEAHINHLRSAPYALAISCYIDGKIIGNSVITFIGDMKASHRATVAITLLEEYWNLGIGSAMLSELIAAAEAHGTEIMELEFIESNSRARALYEKFGFRIVSMKPDTVKLKGGRYANEYYMQKRLK